MIFMEQLNRIHEQDKSWVIIVPVSRVILTNAVNHEFRIGQVVFIDRRKLPRVRRRLSIPRRISEIRNDYSFTGRIFDSSDTLAVLRHWGKLQELRNKCIRIVRDELAILASSQLGYSKRRSGRHPAIAGERTGGSIDRLFLDAEGSEVALSSHKRVGTLMPLVLNGVWQSFQKSHFFYRLLRVLDGDIEVSRSWRNDLRRAAILVGQSQCSDDVAQGFLWNMIALELLLTQRDSKCIDALPKQAEAFLGWVGFWELSNYEERIREAYRKRCDFVHRGRRDHITIGDLLFTDDLLFNILTNLLVHIKRFSSKKEVIQFAKEVEAERVLGVKPRVRPQSLVFVSRTYTKDDYEGIL